ncbi:MAG TPA: hypothetical protein VI837_09880 [Blastocatellia bacterium]|nr:hypothetical protein [Blastocatellia bacterium]
MIKQRMIVCPADRLGYTYRLQSDRASVGEMKFYTLAHRVAVVSVGKRSIELMRGGGDLEFCCANEGGERQALMLVNLPSRAVRIFGSGETTYLVDTGHMPISQLVITRKGIKPGVLVTRRCIGSREQIQSEVRQGEFGGEELVTLVSLAAFYLLSSRKAA